VARTDLNLATASQRAAALLLLSEELIEVSTEFGVETEDTPFIAVVKDTAARISRVFESAVEAGQISLRDLGDVQYREIAGSNPKQFRTRYLDFTDRVLPPIQEPLLELSEKVVFCAAVDRNGYLPTHNRKFSAPPGRDPVWNAANCRNRRIFNDRTGLGAATNRKPFLLQTYRRDMGGGNFVLMKDLSAPIVVFGRHWGGLRLAYRFE
jgi:methyl-accepting chemotaxis protein